MVLQSEEQLVVSTYIKTPKLYFLGNENEGEICEYWVIILSQEGQQLLRAFKTVDPTLPVASQVHVIFVTHFVACTP